jgi:cytochrome c oxidase assembly factor 4
MSTTGQSTPYLDTNEIIERTGCSELHDLLMICMYDNKDWRKCQKEVQDFKKCYTENKDKLEKNN